MAKIEFKGILEYEKQLNELQKKDLKKAIRYAIYPAADLVVKEIKLNVPSKSGELEESIYLSPMQEDDNGFIYTKVGFAGYDSNGTPNALKAAVLEHGKSGRTTGKKRFISKSVRKTKKKAEQLMETMLDKYFYEKFRKY